MRTVILAHEKFPDRAKTAQGILRYADDEVVAVLDRSAAGTSVADHVPDLPDAPVVVGMDEVEGPVDRLVIGIAPIGGGFEESWRPDVRAALRRGCDVVAGLHYFLADDEEFARLAAEHGCRLHDVRRPPDDLTVAEGTAADADCEILLTVGTDCSVGKMTTTMELVAALHEAGHDAAVIPTGQTGIMIEGWGVPVDRVVSDFTAGAVERMIHEAAPDNDYLVVEGQGAITHPAYSAVTCGILHGAMADRLVLCHEAGREAVHGYESFPLPSVDRVADLYESLADPVHETAVVAGAVNTSGIEDDGEARRAVDRVAAAVDGPATDPIRFGVGDAILEVLT